MNTYIGCKIIQAEPMTLSEYNAKFNKVVPAGDYGEEGYHVRYPDGYDSWSPKAVFEAAYRKVSAEEYELFKKTS